MCVSNLYIFKWFILAWKEPDAFSGKYRQYNTWIGFKAESLKQSTTLHCKKQYCQEPLWHPSFLSWLTICLMGAPDHGCKKKQNKKTGLFLIVPMGSQTVMDGFCVADDWRPGSWSCHSVCLECRTRIQGPLNWGLAQRLHCQLWQMVENSKCWGEIFKSDLGEHEKDSWHVQERWRVCKILIWLAQLKMSVRLFTSWSYKETYCRYNLNIMFKLHCLWFKSFGWKWIIGIHILILIYTETIIALWTAIYLNQNANWKMKLYFLV